MPKRPFIVPIFIPHSGCPHQCVFCNQKAITGTAEKLPPDSEIYTRISKFLKYKRHLRSHAEVSFYGGNFLGLPESQILRLLDQAMPFADTGKINAIRFSTRPDTIDKHRLNLIGAYPISTIELGVQSMDDRVLNLSNRGHTAKDTEFATGILKENGYNVGLQMMTGLPGDSLQGSFETAEKMISLKPDFVRIYPTLVLKGSKLAQWFKEGSYTPVTLEDCIEQVKSIYLLFAANGIPVIRMGLQASEELNSDLTVLAGPYHPSLGHMVLSSIMLERAMAKIKEQKIKNNGVTLIVHPDSISRMQGLNRSNIEKIKRALSIQTVFIKTDASMLMDEVRVE